MAGSKGSKYYDIFLDYSISLEHRQLGTLITRDTFTLLKAIHDSGSLKAAAENMDISYRKAWGIIEDLEKKLGFPLVQRQRGGNEGGKTLLTPDGMKLIDSHGELRREIDLAIHKITREFFHNLNE